MIKSKTKNLYKIEIPTLINLNISFFSKKLNTQYYCHIFSAQKINTYFWIIQITKNFSLFQLLLIESLSESTAANSDSATRFESTYVLHENFQIFFWNSRTFSEICISL